jgi:hypothetical protein
MRKHVQWSVQDAAELHAAVLIAAASACAGSARDTELFLKNIAMALIAHASETSSMHVGDAMIGISKLLLVTEPPASLYDETGPRKLAN